MFHRLLTLDFAILSDIEVFFMLTAAKGDDRSNVVQAPTVTMFNGQSASIVDATTRPFVTSVIQLSVSLPQDKNL